MRKLLGKEPPKPRDVMKVFDPVRDAQLSHALKNDDQKRAANLIRNWRKVLIQTGVLEKKNRGRPRKGTG